MAIRVRHNLAEYEYGSLAATSAYLWLAEASSCIGMTNMRNTSDLRGVSLRPLRAADVNVRLITGPPESNPRSAQLKAQRAVPCRIRSRRCRFVGPTAFGTRQILVVIPAQIPTLQQTDQRRNATLHAPSNGVGGTRTVGRAEAIVWARSRIWLISAPGS